MHKQRPQTVYRNMPFLIGTIFENCDKWYRTWRVEHPEFTRIVFHGLRHSSATYQLMISGGDVKTVQKPCKWRTKKIPRGILRFFVRFWCDRGNSNPWPSD
jgi:integrase